MDQAPLALLAPAAIAQQAPPRGLFVGYGFVIHGLAFTFQDGSRTGKVMEDDHSLVDLTNQERMAHRAPQWHPLWDGEYPLALTGFASRVHLLACYLEITTNQRTLPPLWHGPSPARRAIPLPCSAHLLHQRHPVGAWLSLPLSPRSHSVNARCPSP